MPRQQTQLPKVGAHAEYHGDNFFFFNQEPKIYNHCIKKINFGLERDSVKLKLSPFFACDAMQ